MTHRPSVTTIVSHYLPGFKAGGPIRSVANVIARLGHEFDFRVITRDRDLGDKHAYPNLRPNTWQQVGLAQVAYVSQSVALPLHMMRALRSARPDVVYLNSFFDAQWCLTPLLLMRSANLARSSVVIAPRGQFGAGALQFKSTKKRAYVAAFKSLGLTRRVIWQATSELEHDDIHRVMGRHATVVMASNVSDPPLAHTIRDPKTPGHLRLAYYSRVTPKKNLLGAIERLANVPAKTSFDIWGPIEDAAYQERCQQRIAELPHHVCVRWCGPIQHDCVANTLSQYDAMFLPTLGENFGHVIIEALAAGCPVVISDRTPWRGLEELGVGWDLSLECPEEFDRALATIARMDESTHQRMRARAVQIANETIRNPDLVEAHRQLFALAVDTNSRARCVA